MNVRWRSVALPAEHGGWAFISEPVILGLLLAPTVAGLALGVAAFGAFLLRQPFKLYAKDVRQRRIVPRTHAARRFLLIYGGVTVVAAVLAVVMAPSPDTLLPLLLALPLLLVQTAYDVRNQSRAAAAELAGALATGALASVIVLMAGWSWTTAWALWLALAIKAVTAVLYVRSRLRLERGRSAGVALAVGTHVLGLAILIGVVLAGWLPWTVPVAMALLTIRAGVGLSPLRKPRPPKVIGFQEMAYGLTFVGLVALGF